MDHIRRRVAFVTAAITIFQMHYGEHLPPPFRTTRFFQYPSSPSTGAITSHQPRCLWLDHISILASQDITVLPGYSLDSSSTPSIQTVVPVQLQLSSSTTLQPCCIWLDHINVLASQDMAQTNTSATLLPRSQPTVPAQPQSSWLDHMSAIHMRQAQRELFNAIVVDDTTVVALIVLLLCFWRRRLCFRKLKSCINGFIRLIRCLSLCDCLIFIVVAIISATVSMVLFLVYKVLGFDDPTERIQHLLVIVDRENLSKALDALEAKVEQNRSASEDAAIEHKGIMSRLNCRLSHETNRANANSEEVEQRQGELEKLRTKYDDTTVSNGALQHQLTIVRQQRDRAEREHATEVNSKAAKITNLELAFTSEKDRVASLLRESDIQAAKIAELVSTSTSVTKELTASRKALAAEKYLKDLDSELHTSQLEGKDFQINELNRRIEALNTTVSKVERDVAHAQQQLQMDKRINEVINRSLQVDIGARDTRVVELENKVAAQDAAMQSASLQLRDSQNLVEVNAGLLRAANEKNGRLEWRNTVLEREVETMRNGMARPKAPTATAAEQDPVAASGMQSLEDSMPEQLSPDRAHLEPPTAQSPDTQPPSTEEPLSNLCDIENSQVPSVQASSSVPLGSEGSYKEVFPEAPSSTEVLCFLSSEAGSSSVDEPSAPIEPNSPITAPLNTLVQDDDLTRGDTPSHTLEEDHRHTLIPTGTESSVISHELHVSEMDEEEIRSSEEVLFLDDPSTSAVNLHIPPPETSPDRDSVQLSPATSSVPTTPSASSGSPAPSCDVSSERSESPDFSTDYDNSCDIPCSSDSPLSTPPPEALLGDTDRRPRPPGSIGNNEHQQPRVQLNGGRSVFAAAFAHIDASKLSGRTPPPRSGQKNSGAEVGLVAPVRTHAPSQPAAPPSEVSSKRGNKRTRHSQPVEQFVGGHWHR